MYAHNISELFRTRDGVSTVSLVHLVVYLYDTAIASVQSDAPQAARSASYGSEYNLGSPRPAPVRCRAPLT